MSLNIPPEGRGPISLYAYCFIGGMWRQCIILEAVNQVAQVSILGALPVFNVPFSQIQNVCLKYADGTILQNFGAPRTPEQTAWAGPNV